MTLLLQYLSSGVATGCTFALVATGFVAIYRVTRVVNFAQGAFAVIGGMAAFALLGRGLPHVVAEGPPDAVREDPAVIAAYLGHERERVASA